MSGGRTINPNSLDFEVRLVAASASTIIEAQIYSYLSIITDSGCTATVTRVDNASGTVISGGSGAPSSFTVAVSTFKTIPVDWQYYTVAAAGGVCRVCLG
jgi:adhesin HecA-like repeat protein